MDALMCSQDEMKVKKMISGFKISKTHLIQETRRVLKPNGYFFCISYGTPEWRTYLFDDFEVLKSIPLPGQNRANDSSPGSLFTIR